MESQGTDQSIDYLFNMFGGVVNKEIIAAVLHNCDGDLNLSVDCIIRMINENCTANEFQSTTPVSDNQNEINIPQNQSPGAIAITAAPMSYSAAFQNTGAIPKHHIQSNVPNPKKSSSDYQFDKLIGYHNNGYCTLIILRGAPGSGKTFLAEKLIKMLIGPNTADLKTYICSADDYFMFRGQYCFDKQKLHEAHQWCQKRARLAIEQGLSPVIVDNTNIEIWEMEPYVRMGTANGYFIEIVEPNTPWAKNSLQLSRKNVHNVPYSTIKRMIDQYVRGLTGEALIKNLGLSYPQGKLPPTIRSMPSFEHQERILRISEVENQVSAISINEPVEKVETIESLTELTENIESPSSSHGNQSNEKRSHLYEDIQRKLEEFAKVEQEWEAGENWVDGEKSSNDVINADENSSTVPKPQRANSAQPTTEKLLKNIDSCDDWSQISMFMPPLKDVIPSTSKLYQPTKSIETKSSSTCMEIGDLQNKNIFKVITATPRDINEYHISFHKEKIPEKRMLDKSSMTNDNIIMEPAKRCKSEEKHFKEFRKLFKNISKNSLRDIFDQCLGDVNWAVEIVLDGMASNELKTRGKEEESEEELDQEDGDSTCSCMAAYSVLPDTCTETKIPTKHSDATVDKQSSTPQSQKKSKKDNNVSGDSLIIKRLIEQNVGFSDNHYSDHCLKIRKFRRGEHEIWVERDEMTSVEEIPKSAQEDGYQDTASSLPENQAHVEQETNDIEETININVGREFITNLDLFFGRKDMAYPNTVLPKINIPVSLLNEINALWMESLMYQLNEHDKLTAIMIREDEDFARQLASKEAELALSGKEPAVPDFKEIMDMDFALSLYQKDVSEWRNKEPNDLAAKLTREKLYNLFPDVQKETLSELLMAHDNNFQATVEVLLISTGKDDILKEENGLNKFVIQKEMERQEKILEEERKALMEVDWPLLPQGKVVEMSVVDKYRNEAEQHLASRNLNHQKANEYVRRGMIQVANYYNELAAFHKLKYEQANSLAAASLIQVNASNCPDNATIDLHYLRVSEAKEALDLFIDTHIQRLKEQQGTSSHPRTCNLFFITGRGLHSNGRPRVKPAVQRRLQERCLIYSERNPGLLSARVSSEDKMSYQFVSPSPYAPAPSSFMP